MEDEAPYLSDYASESDVRVGRAASGSAGSHDGRSVLTKGLLPHAISVLSERLGLRIPVSYWPFFWIWPGSLLVTIAAFMFSTSRNPDWKVNERMVLLFYLPLVASLGGIIFVYTILRGIYRLKGFSYVMVIVPAVLYPIFFYAVRDVGKYHDAATDLVVPPRTFYTFSLAWLPTLPFMWLAACISVFFLGVRGSAIEDSCTFFGRFRIPVAANVVLTTLRATVVFGILLTIIPFSSWYGEMLFNGEVRGSARGDGTYHTHRLIENAWARSFTVLGYPIALGLVKVLATAALPRHRRSGHNTLSVLLFETVALTLASYPYRNLINSLGTWGDLGIIFFIETIYKLAVLGLILYSPIGAMLSAIQSSGESSAVSANNPRRPDSLEGDDQETAELFASVQFEDGDVRFDEANGDLLGKTPQPRVGDDGDDDDDDEEHIAMLESPDAQTQAGKVLAIKIFVQHISDIMAPITFMLLFLVIIGNYTMTPYWGIQQFWGEPKPYIGPPRTCAEALSTETPQETYACGGYDADHPHLTQKFYFYTVAFFVELVFLLVFPIITKQISEGLAWALRSTVGKPAVVYSFFNTSRAFNPLHYGTKFTLKQAWHVALASAFILTVMFFNVQAPFWRDLEHYKQENMDRIRSDCADAIDGRVFKDRCFSICSLDVECNISNPLCHKAMDTCLYHPTVPDEAKNDLCANILSRCGTEGFENAICHHQFETCVASANNGTFPPLCDVIQQSCLANGTAVPLCADIADVCLDEGLANQLCNRTFSHCASATNFTTEPQLCQDIQSACIEDPTQTLCTEIFDGCLSEGLSSPVCSSVYHMCEVDAGEGIHPPLCSKIQQTCIGGSNATLCSDIFSQCTHEGFSNPICNGIFLKCEAGAANGTLPPLCKHIQDGCFANGNATTLCSDIMHSCASQGLQEPLCNDTFQRCVTAAANHTEPSLLCEENMELCLHNSTVPLCEDIRATCLRDGVGPNPPGNPVCQGTLEKCKEAARNGTSLSGCRAIQQTCLKKGRNATLCGEIMQQCAKAGLGEPLCNGTIQACINALNNGEKPPLCLENIATCLEQPNLPLCTNISSICMRDGLKNPICKSVFHQCEVSVANGTQPPLCANIQSHCLQTGNSTALCKDIMQTCSSQGLVQALCNATFEKCQSAAKQNKTLPLCAENVEMCLHDPNATLCQDISKLCMHDGFIGSEAQPVCGKVFEKCKMAAKSSTKLPLCGSIQSHCLQVGNTTALCKDIMGECRDEGLATPLCNETFQHCASAASHNETLPTLCQQTVGDCLFHPNATLCKDISHLCTSSSNPPPLCKDVIEACGERIDNGEVPPTCVGICEKRGLGIPMCQALCKLDPKAPPCKSGDD